LENKPAMREPKGPQRFMKPPSQMTRTAILVEGAMMVSLGFVLSIIPFFHMPWGGSITCFSTLPLIVMSFRHGLKWGVSAAAVFGVVQSLMGVGSIAAAGSFGAMILCALLDYFFAYAAVGLSGPIANSMARYVANPIARLVTGIVSTGLMRLFCSFLSGVLIWGAWAPEGTPVWLYSLTYNAGWCLPDMAIVLAAAVALSLAHNMRILGLAGSPASRPSR